MSNPNVSVVIAVRNESKYIESALRSVLNQKGLIHEVILVDDNSTDNTFEIAGKLTSEYSNLILRRNLKIGKASAYNFGVSISSGDFVCLFAGDDLMPDGSLFLRWEKVSASDEPENTVGLCRLISISENKKFDGELIPKKPGKGGFTGCSYMMGRSAVRYIFPVPETLPNEDSWLLYGVSMIPQIKIVHSEIVGCFWRVHDGNSINMMVDFKTYNQKITPRMKAAELFFNQYKEILPNAVRRQLVEEIKCEDYRKKGNVIGVLSTKLPLVQRLRFVSMTNGLFYGIRKMFFKFFSGW